MFEKLFAKRGLSLDRLRVLLEVREAGSVVKAAGGDPVRQSQYSRQLKELDEYFGVELTCRKGRHLVLTAIGEELAKLVQEHFVALGNFKRRMAAEPVPVFIGAGESLIHWLLLPLAGKLQRDLPEVTLRMINLTSTMINQKLIDREIDLGILRKDAIAPTISHHVIGKIVYSLYAPKALLSGSAAKKTFLLNKLPIATMPGNTSFGRHLHQLAEKANIQINVRLECDTFTGLAQAVQTGEYAAILPDLAIYTMDDKTDKITLPLLKPLTREISLAWLKRKVNLCPEWEKTRQWLTQNLNMTIK